MHTNSITLKPATKQLYQVHTEHSHSRLSLGRVLYAKFLRWVDKASLSTLLRTAAGLGLVAGAALVVIFPAFMVGMLVDVLQWNGYRVPILVLTVGLCVRARWLIRWALRFRVKRAGANQHTYRGLPVDELASYLLEHRAFTRDAAGRHFGLCWKKHDAIAKELEHHQVLVRGDNNARVLNGTISREQLVRQLRDDFPLSFCDGAWAERRGSYELFLRDRERQQTKEKERVERLERRADRAQAKIAQASGFQRVAALM